MPLHVRKLKGGKGYAAWTWEQIEAFKAQAKPELWHAAALALYSGQRQADCLKMTWADVEGGRIAVEQAKTGKKLRIPAHRELLQILQEVPTPRPFSVLTNTRVGTP